MYIIGIHLSVSLASLLPMLCSAVYVKLVLVLQPNKKRLNSDFPLSSGRECRFHSAVGTLSLLNNFEFYVHVEHDDMYTSLITNSRSSGMKLWKAEKH